MACVEQKSDNTKTVQNEKLSDKKIGDTTKIAKREPVFALYPELIEVEGGIFMMGDSSNQPIHKVELSSFYIGKYEVTVGQFKQFIDETHYETASNKYQEIYYKKNYNKPCGYPNWQQFQNCDTIPPSLYCLPVSKVNYLDALVYCKWLSKKLGKKYTLPSEAQWEYAAKGGKKSKNFKYIGSNDAKEIMELRPYKMNAFNDNYTCVGHLLPNELGIYNMAGSVREWCLDGDWEYEASLDKDPIQTKLYGKGMEAGRVVRGACYLSSAKADGIATYRDGGNQGLYGYTTGFRVAMIPE